MSRPYETLLPASASRPDWLAARRTGLGGSDAPAVLGWGGHRSALDVYADKTMPEADDADAESASWGRLLEDVIAREWARREGKTVRRGPALVRSTRWPWMVASIDRNIVTPPRTKPVELLEVKTRSAWVGRDWDDELPADVTAQSLHYLAVYGLRVCRVACLVGGQELRTFTVTADDELIADIAEAEREWWQAYVEPRKLPPIGGGGNGPTLARLHPNPEGVLDLDLDGLDLLRRRAKADEAYKAAKTERDEIDDSVRLLLGDRVEGHVDGRKYVSWAPTPGSRHVDYGRLEDGWPDAYEATVSRGAPSRSLRYAKKELP
jgi:putative phage-type endonuclease